MEKLMNYIENGKGRGLIYFLVFSVIFCVAISIALTQTLSKSLADEQLGDFVNRMPTIQIDDGRVVAPQDAFVVVPFVQGVADAFILNTTDTNLDQLPFENGMYMTKKSLYVKAGTDIQELSLSKLGDMTVTPDTLRSLMKAMVIMAAAMMAVLFFIALWIGYGLLYVFVKLFFLILGRTTCPYNRGRSVYLAWSTILTLDFILLLFGHGFSITAAFGAALVLAILIVFMTPLHSMAMEETLRAVQNMPETPDPVYEEGTHTAVAADKKTAKKAVSQKTMAEPAVKKTAVQKTSMKKAAVQKSVKKPTKQTPAKKGAAARKTSAKK